MPALNLVRLAIDLALSRTAPANIPLSDRRKVAARNYGAVYAKEETYRYVVDYLTTEGARARVRDEADNTLREVTLFNSALATTDLTYVYYLGEVELRSDSALHFF